jgi:CDP-diacylglycerol--glycerol-3-phosphate 3-phosphatidyltransferase
MLPAMLNVAIRGRIEAITLPVGRGLSKAGITPNALTAAGLLGTLGAAVLVATGHFGAGAIVLIASALADLLDGAVAKAAGIASRWGAFLDSISDRIGDASILGAIAWRFRLEEPRVAALAVSTLVLVFVVSYMKARAEGLGFTCEGGLAERAERLIVLIAGLLLSALEAALWLLAALAAITIAQRARLVWRQAAARP